MFAPAEHFRSGLHLHTVIKEASQKLMGFIQNGFDNEKYITQQTESILRRVARFNNKLYLEFGGKLLYDYHAARVLPGYDPNVKMRLIKS
jgi:hypothetical protein